MEGHKLTAQGRYLILHHKSNGHSLRKIGEVLNRPSSAISQELMRHVSGDGRYRPDKATATPAREFDAAEGDRTLERPMSIWCAAWSSASGVLSRSAGGCASLAG